MVVNKTNKTELKLKKVQFDKGELIDEKGHVIILEEVLKKIFDEKEFDLTASIVEKDEYEVEDLD